MLWAYVAIAGLFITPIALIMAGILAWKGNPNWKKAQRVGIVSLGLMVLSLFMH